MKKIKLSFAILSLVVIFILNNTWSHSTLANGEQDLLTIATVLKAENIKINQWSLHAREKMEHAKQLKDVKEQVKILKRKFSNWNWTVSSESNHWEAVATKVSSGRQQEKIQVLSTLTNHKPQTYIIYEVKGENFNKKNEQFIKEELTGTLSDIFRGNTTIFSCLEGEFNDKIKRNLPFTVNHLLSAFQAKEIESLTEKDFISTSAKSPLFAETITNKNQEMNLQMGIRTQGLGARTTLVVGTPIITIEY